MNRGPNYIALPLLLLMILTGGCASDNVGGKAAETRTKITAAEGGGTESSMIKKTIAGNDSATRTEASRATRSATPVDDAPLTGPTLLVTGRITFADGRPATSVGVELKGYVKTSEQQSKQVTLGNAVTDGEGGYQVRGAEATQPQLTITGDLPETQVQLDNSGNRTSTKASLRRINKDVVLAEAHTIAGRVVNEKDEPMPGLAVSLGPIVSSVHAQRMIETRPMTVRETTSSASGEFVFEHIAGGPWNVGALSPEYAPTVTRIDVPTTEPLTLRLGSRGGTVRGHVYLKAESSAVPDMKIALVTAGSNRLAKLESQETRSAGDGSFQFDHVSSGPLVLQLKADQNQEKQLGLAAPFPGPVQLEENETTDVVLFVYPGHTITGLVFDKDTSEPLSAALVSLTGLNPSREATSDGSGNYKLERVFAPEQETVRLSAKLEGFGLDTGNAYQTDISLKLPEEAAEPVAKNIPMVRMVTISGKVVTRDEVPVPTAQVAFVSSRNFSGPKDNRKPVNSDGTFKIETNPFVSGYVDAEASGFAPGKSPLLDLTTQDVEDVKIVMDVGALVRGTVFDPDGQPAAGAKVQNYVSYSFSGGNTYGSYDDVALSGEDGRFTMRDAPVKIELFAGKDGFANSELQSIDLKPGDVRAGIELHLRKSASISGRVVKADKSPVEGAHINVSGVGNSSDNDTTKKDGSFKVDGLAEGVCRLYVYANGKSKTVENIKTGTTDLEIVLESGEKVTLTGTVLDDVTGDPVRDFNLTGTGLKIKMLPEAGKFEISGLNANSSNQISISSPRHDAQKFTIRTSTAERVNQTFRLGIGGVIVGRVVEKGTGKPIPNVVVVNWGTTEFFMRSHTTPPNHSSTDAEGRFILAPAPSGENSVIVKPAEPLTEVAKTVTVKSEETADLGDIEISNGGTIRGRVVRGTGEEPVPDKQVTLNSFTQNLRVNKTATTDPEGAFEFIGLAPATYTLGVGSVSKSQNIAGDETVDVQLRIGGVKMTGTVKRGADPVETSLTASGAGEVTFTAYTQGGAYTLNDILPGKYEFSVGSGATAFKEMVEVPDQGEFQKDFVLPDGQVQVSVVDAADQPVAGAMVSLTLKDSATGVEQSWVSRSQNETSKSDGTASFAGLAPGTYTLSAQKEDAGSAMNPRVEVGDGARQSEQLVLKGDGGTLVSLALNAADGQPITEAWCYLYGPDGIFGHAAKRDSSGFMTIKNIPPGTYRTNVSHWGFSQNEKQVEIKAGETATIEDVLYRAGSVQWILKRADGSPAQGANITLTPLSGESIEQPRTGVTDNSGNYEDRGLAAGVYQVTAQLAGKPAVSETFEVKAQSHTKKENTIPGW